RVSGALRIPRPGFMQGESVMKKQWMFIVPLLLAFVAGITFARAQAAEDGSVSAADQKDDKASGKGDAKGAAMKAGEGAKGGAGEDKAFDEVVKDMEVVKGLFTFYRKPDENKTLMEIAPDQLDKVFLFAASVDQSAGER